MYLSIYVSYCLTLVLLCSCQVNNTSGGERKLPAPQIEALFPRGLKVTVPDFGFTIVTFHGNVNKTIRDIEIGSLTLCDVQTPNDTENRAWVLRDNNVKLNLGDTLYYWISVHNKKRVSRRTYPTEYEIFEYSYEDQSYSITSSDPTDTCPVQDCEASETVVQGSKSVCKGQLIFDEKFGRNKHGLSNWHAEVMFPEGPDFPSNVYMEAETISLENGNLVIKPLLLEDYYHEGILYEELDLSKICTGRLETTECSRRASGANILPPVVTGKVTTRQTFNFKYGRIEVCAKLPAGSWLVPEINLEPRDNIYGNGRYASGLMRIAFARGNPNMTTSLYAGPVLYSKEPFRSALIKEKIGQEDWHKEYHNYTLVWRKDGIHLHVDCEEYGHIEPGTFFQLAESSGVQHADRWLSGTNMAPLDELFYLSLGLRVGGANDFPDGGANKPYQNGERRAMLNFWEHRDAWLPTWTDSSLKVHYVKVYAL
ncbi:beta-1,3-glucan-binding protein [Plutella xylostella]|uniref:beta-1,3-glucan-binding protein n=1 Tax=Plutella xylostella TaxID=51655 RepID=UPI00203247FF|nr:beta-1,3-glucan-binding protein [Plutella xylostella]